MALENRNDQHHIVVDKYHNPGDDYSMTNYDYVMRPEAAGAITLTLPRVSEGKGRFYSILSRGDGAVTIEDNNDDSEQWSDITLNAAGDRVLLYSDGLCWLTLASTISQT